MFAQDFDAHDGFEAKGLVLRVTRCCPSASPLGRRRPPPGAARPPPTEVRCPKRERTCHSLMDWMNFLVLESDALRTIATRRAPLSIARRVRSDTQ